MNQKRKRELRATADESWSRQARDLEDHPPECPVEALVLVLPVETADFLRERLHRGLNGNFMERVAENIIYDAMRKELGITHA